MIFLCLDVLIVCFCYRGKSKHVRTAARGEPVFVGFLTLERLIWVTATSAWVVKHYTVLSKYMAV